MNLSKMTDDLNIIQTLADQPTLDSPTLKSKFDEAGNNIKNYINNILIKGIETGTSEDIKTAKTSITNYVDTSLKKLDEEITNDLNTVKTNIEKTMDTKIKALEKKITDISGNISSKVFADITELYYNANLANTTGNLSQEYSKFNFLIIVCRTISNNKATIMVPTWRLWEDLKNELVIGLGDYDVNLQIRFTSKTRFETVCNPSSSSSQVGIREIYGVGKRN